MNITTYKGYTLYQINNPRTPLGESVEWADHGGWLNCSFESVDTAKYFIDNKKKLTDNFFTVITLMRDECIKSKQFVVNKDIINNYLTA